MQLTRRHFIGTGAVAALGGVMGTSRAAVHPAKPSVGDGTISAQMRLSLAAYSFRNYLPNNGKPGKMTLHDLFELAAVWRIDAVEPTSYYFSSEDKEYLHSLKAKAFQLGLDISGTAIRNNFGLPAGKKRDTEIAHVKKWIDHSVAFGAPCIRIFAANPDKDIPREQAFEWMVENMKACCNYAGTQGVFLAIENHGYLTETADAVLRIIEAVDHPWLGVNLDTGNFKEDPYESMAKVASKAINVQVKTEVQAADGKVEADFGRIADILREARYRGYVALEYEGKQDPMEAVPGYLEKLRGAITD